MMPPFVLTPSAARDIDGILAYVVESAGPRRALRVHRKLHEAFLKLAAYPNLVGHHRPDLTDASFRVFTVFKYLVIYRPDTAPVQVLRVIHGARDVAKALECDG